MIAALKRWESMLALVLVLEFVSFSMLSPYFLDVNTLSDATFNFTERALVALPLALLIIAGEIDISVAGIIALASVAMGFAAEAGVGTPLLVATGLGTGLVAGMRQRRAGDLGARAFDRRHHRHHDAVSRYRLRRAR